MERRAESDDALKDPTAPATCTHHTVNKRASVLAADRRSCPPGDGGGWGKTSCPAPFLPKSKVRPEHIELPAEETHPTPPLTPAVYDGSTRCAIQSPIERPTCLKLPVVSTPDETIKGAQDGSAGSREHDHPEPIMQANHSANQEGDNSTWDRRNRKGFTNGGRIPDGASSMSVSNKFLDLVLSNNEEGDHSARRPRLLSNDDGYGDNKDKKKGHEDEHALQQRGSDTSGRNGDVYKGEATSGKGIANASVAGSGGIGREEDGFRGPPAEIAREGADSGCRHADVQCEGEAKEETTHYLVRQMHSFLFSDDKEDMAGVSPLPGAHNTKASVGGENEESINHNDGACDRPGQNLGGAFQGSPSTSPASVMQNKCAVPVHTRKGTGKRRGKVTVKALGGAFNIDACRQGDLGSKRGKRDSGDDDHGNVEQRGRWQAGRKILISEESVGYRRNHNGDDHNIPRPMMTLSNSNHGGDDDDGDQFAEEPCDRRAKADIMTVTDGIDAKGVMDCSGYVGSGRRTRPQQGDASNGCARYSQGGVDADLGGDGCWPNIRAERGANTKNGDVPSISEVRDGLGGHEDVGVEHSAVPAREKSTTTLHSTDIDNSRHRSQCWSPTNLEDPADDLGSSGKEKRPAEEDEASGEGGEPPPTTDSNYMITRRTTGGGRATVRASLVEPPLQEAHSKAGQKLIWKMWLNSDEKDEINVNEGEQQLHTVHVREQQDSQGNLPPSRRTCFAPQTQPQQQSPDARPWLLKDSPEWVDFTRRRSSLLSLHFGNRNSIFRASSTQDPKPEHAGGSTYLHQKNVSSDSRGTRMDQMVATSGGGTGGSDGNPPHAETQSSCSETGYSLTASDIHHHHQQPLQHHPPSQIEKSEKVGASAVIGACSAPLGKHGRASGTCVLDNSTNSSSFSCFSSMSDTDKSSIEVYDFLEESAESACDEGGTRSLDGTNIARAASERGSSDDSDSRRGMGNVGDGGDGDGGSGKDLNTQDVRLLLEGRQLRNALLAVEDLHFSEIPLSRQVELMKSLSTAHFSCGQVIYKGGDLSDSLYFMLGPTAEPEGNGLTHEGSELTIETEKKEGRGEDNGDVDEPPRAFAFVPTKRFFGEEGLVYSKDHRRSSTVRAAVDMFLAVLPWPAFPLWWDFRLYLLMKKVSFLAKLSPTARAGVLHALKYADYEPGELVIKEGEPGDKFYMITHGTVEVTTMKGGLQDSDSSFSRSSSTCSEETDIDERNDHASHGDTHDCEGARAHPCPVVGEEGRPAVEGPLSTEGGEGNGDDRGGLFPDPLETVFVPHTGAKAKAMEKPTINQPEDDLGGLPTKKFVICRQTPPPVAKTSDKPLTETSTEVQELPPGKQAPDRINWEVDSVGGMTATAATAETVEKKASPFDSSSEAESSESRKRERGWSGLDSSDTEKVLTRLYEGHCFGEMALIYDEPRNASVRAATKVTCVYLHKDAFRKHLCDKTFNKLMQQVAMKTAYYREQRERVAVNPNNGFHLASTGKSIESWKSFASVRALATVRLGARSSFRWTEKLKVVGNAREGTNERLVNDYRVCEKIGEGSFGAVYKVVHVHSGEVNAMKVISKPRRGGQKYELLERSLRREVSAMQMLRHPNVVKLWEVIDDPRSRKVYMIQEFMAGGSLLKEKYAVEPIPEQIAFLKFVQAARGVQYIHSYGICHGDIKPSNILEDAEGTVKIADFGACVILNPEDEGGDGDISCSGSSAESSNDVGRDRDRRKARRKKRGQRVGGTPTFHPPELFGEGGVSRISFASDVWALGITLYQMVVGKIPFFGRSYNALMASIKMQELSFPFECHIEPYLVNLLQRMLDKNPKNRITLEGVMNHEWVTKEGVHAAQPGGEGLEIPGQERPTSRIQYDDKQMRGARPYVEHHGHGEGAIAQVKAGGKDASNIGASIGTTNTNSLKKNGKSNKKKSFGTEDHPGQFSLSVDAVGIGDRLGDRVESTPSSFPASSPASSGKADCSPPLTREDLMREDEQQFHKQQQHTTNVGGGGRSATCCSFSRMGSVSDTQKEMGTDTVVKEDEDGDGEAIMWSDDTDKVPSTRTLEAIVDKGNFFIPPVIALHALTVTLPEEIVTSATSKARGSSVGGGRTASVPSGTLPQNSPVLSSNASTTLSGLQQKGQKWESGNTVPTPLAAREETHPLSSLRPPRLATGPSTTTSNAVASSSLGPEISSSSIPSETAEEWTNNTGFATNLAAAAANGGKLAIAGESTCNVRHAKVAASVRPQEDEIDVVANFNVPLLQRTRKQSKQQTQMQSKKTRSPDHQQTQTPLSNLLSSPSLLCPTRPTPHRTDAENATIHNDGGSVDSCRSGDGGGNYRSVCSCPAIGVTDTSPLFPRHELTDRSALERSQRLVRKPDFLMLKANHTLGSNKRVLFSSLKAVSSLRASAEGEVGSRRSSVGTGSFRPPPAPRRERCTKSASISTSDVYWSGLGLKSVGEEMLFASKRPTNATRHDARKSLTFGGEKMTPMPRATREMIHNNSNQSSQESEDSFTNALKKQPRGSFQAAGETPTIASDRPPDGSRFSFRVSSSTSATRNGGRNDKRSSPSPSNCSNGSNDIIDMATALYYGRGVGSSNSVSREDSSSGSIFVCSSDGDSEASSRPARPKRVPQASPQSPRRGEEEAKGASIAERAEQLKDVQGREKKGGGSSGASGGCGWPGFERRTTLSRCAISTGMDESMCCIDEEEPELGTRVAPTSTPASNIRTRTSWSTPRIVSDSSSGPAGSNHERTDYNSTCNSYLGSSSTESCAGQMTPVKGRRRMSYRRFCARGSIESATYLGGCPGGGDGGSNDGGDSGGGVTMSAEFNPCLEEGDREEHSADESCSSDSLGETTSVADITDNLDCIGNGVTREDAELLPLDVEEIINLTTSGEGLRRSSSYKSEEERIKVNGDKGSSAKHITTVAGRPLDEFSAWGHVQARAWAGQINIDAGVRFGVSLDQGKRCAMEDAVACLTDAFSMKASSIETESTTPAERAAVTSARTATGSATRSMAVTTKTSATSSVPAVDQGGAAYFGVFDGHGGADVALRLQEVLHHRVLNDPHFPSDIPQAIIGGFLETDLECLEISDGKRQAGIEDANISSVVATSLKRQKTEQVFSGAVAVIAIIHRPSLPPATSIGDDLSRPLPTPRPPPPPRTPPSSTTFITRDVASEVRPSSHIRVSSSAGPVVASGGGAKSLIPSTPINSEEPCVPTSSSTQTQQQHQDMPHYAGTSPSSNTPPWLPVPCVKTRHRQEQHHPQRDRGFLYVANVGDCRAVLCRGGKAVVITTDHTPSVPSEAARVEAAGGFISRGRVNGILGVSRSFGDIHCKVYPPREGNGLWDEQQVISRPDVHSIRLTEADSFLILACDGVWDVLSNQEAVSYVHRRLLTHRDVQRAAVELIDKALVTSGDNCSCVVVCLNQVAAPRKRRSRRKSSLKSTWTKSVMEVVSTGGTSGCGRSESIRNASSGTRSIGNSNATEDPQTRENVRKSETEVNMDRSIAA